MFAHQASILLMLLPLSDVTLIFKSLICFLRNLDDDSLGLGENRASASCSSCRQDFLPRSRFVLVNGSKKLSLRSSRADHSELLVLDVSPIEPFLEVPELYVHFEGV